MSPLVRLARLVARLLGTSVVGRFAKRYPIVAVTLMVLRWWRKRSVHADHKVVRLRAGETVTVSDRQA